MQTNNTYFVIARWKWHLAKPTYITYLTADFDMLLASTQQNNLRFRIAMSLQLQSTSNVCENYERSNLMAVTRAHKHM